MRFLARAIMGTVMIVICAGLIGAGVYRYVEAGRAPEKGGWPGRGGGAPGERAYIVDIKSLEPIEATPIQTAFGEIRAARSVDIRAGSAGRLLFVSPDLTDGGTVREGEVIARIDPATADNRTADAEAALSDRELTLSDAQRSLTLAQTELAAAERQEALRRDAYERQATLAQRGFAARAAVETAELALASAAQATLSRRQAVSGARARLAQATVAVERARLTIDDARRGAAEAVVTAPFTGVVEDSGISAGRLVTVNEQLARLTDLSSLEARFSVSSAAFARLIGGDGALLPRPVRVFLRFDSDRMVASGRLDRVAAAVDPGRGGRVLFARLTEIQGLRPGDFVTLEIEEPALTRVARVEPGAVSEDGKLLIVGEDGRLSEVQVRVAHREADGVLIADAPFGRRYVADRQPQLGPGVRVRAPGEEPPERPRGQGRPGGGEGRPGGSTPEGNRPAEGRPAEGRPEAGAPAANGAQRPADGQREGAPSS